MTPEEQLDEARAKEAGGDPVKAARLARENWTPPEPEPADPDVLAFREWESAQWPAYTCTQAAYLAGARMAREREQERAKGLVEYVEAHVKGVNVIFTHSEVLAKYRGGA
jgi:hypothetical protein